VKTAVELLRSVAQKFGDRDAYVEPGRRITFGQWDRSADGVAAAFADAGVGRGDVVVLVLPSSIEYAVCYQAAMRLGAITSGVNPRLGPAEVASIVERTRPRLVIRGADSPLDLGAAMTLDPPRRRPRLASSDRVAIVWTSGTTGAPKGAVFDHDNLRAVAQGAGDLGRPFDRRLNPLPFAHVGYMTRPWEEIANVIATVLTPVPWQARDALRMLQDHGVTVAQGVPTQWRLMLAQPDFESFDLSALRIAGTGAATVAPSLLEEMRQRLGCPVVIGYTSTEAALTSGTRPGDSPDLMARTVGRARDNVELDVVDDRGRPLGPGQVGRVRCRSGAVMRGYWGDPSLTDDVLDDEGRLTTGDLGSLDTRGYLTLVGRHSEMYIRGGYNVYPAEVERVLAGHPEVDQVAVIGVADPVLSEIGVAFVVPGPKGSPALADLRRWCQRELADYKAPDRLHVVTELPLTSVGKVDKLTLRSSVEVQPPVG